MSVQQQAASPVAVETPAIQLEDSSVVYGDRVIWEHMSLTVERGEFLAVLGPNGAGKTTLLKVLLGLEDLSGGSVRVLGRPARGGSSRVGYIPQQRIFDRDLPVRGRDIVWLGVNGHALGLPLAGREARRRVDEAIRSVGAEDWADSPIGLLSGGEQQRLRVAQALLGDPELLLCDEPLMSLDLCYQQDVVALLDRRRREAGTAVVFVTHDINPVLPYADRVLHFASGRWAIGSAEEILTSERLTELYGTPVDVERIGDRLVVTTDVANSTCLHPDDHRHGGGD
jgi:zinc/manganese transport system ATP-binding protein